MFTSWTVMMCNKFMLKIIHNNAKISWTVMMCNKFMLKIIHNNAKNLRTFLAILFILSSYVETSPHVESNFFNYTLTNFLFYLYFY